MGKEKIFVLDVPCGYGRFSSLLLGKGFTLMNSDISFHMVSRAIEQSRRHSEKTVSGVVADVAGGLPFKEGVFDLLFSMRFLHHIHESGKREKVFKEFSAVSSGWVLLSYYQMNFLHVLQRKFRKKIKKSRTKIKMISKEELKRVAALGGLEVVRIFPLIRGIHSQHIVLLKKSEIR
jgi:SAM-dependent methyltransferase